jgi:hypothetical protein
MQDQHEDQIDPEFDLVDPGSDPVVLKTPRVYES